ncbi:MAG: hypothetical protein OEO77_08140 [Acidimicrobiia bacterium]|nr:hypothetical protein [Acidimicrobiia bacterium]
MRLFEFEIQLPGGQIVFAEVAARTWSDAFSEACRQVEKKSSLLPHSGIVCRSYRAEQLPERARPALAA